MHLYRVVPPAVLPISLAEVKSGAGLDGLDEEDARITALIRAAVDRVDGPDGEIQRALITQTWEMRLDAFPGTWRGRPGFRWPVDFCPSRVEIEIPLPPLQSVDEITYTADGVEVTLDPSAYRVAGVGDRHKARLMPVTAWPSADDVHEAVMITFTAGYGDSWNDVPEVIRQGIIATVKGLYDECDSGLAEKLLRPYRVDAGFA